MSSDTGLTNQPRGSSPLWLQLSGTFKQIWGKRIPYKIPWFLFFNLTLIFMLYILRQNCNSIRMARWRQQRANQSLSSTKLPIFLLWLSGGIPSRKIFPKTSGRHSLHSSPKASLLSLRQFRTYGSTYLLYIHSALGEKPESCLFPARVLT